MKSTEIYQQALSSMSKAVIFTDPTRSENPVVQVNPAFVELTGYPEEEAVGRPWHFLCGEGTSKRAQKAIQRALDSAESITTEILNYRSDGRSFWNELTMDPVYDNNDELLCFTGVLRDITETKKQQQKLEESSRRFLELLGKNEDIVWMFNRDLSELHYINGAYEEISGRPLHHLYYDPHDFLEAIHPNDRGRVKDAIETLSGGEPVDLEYRANKKEDFGRWVWVKGYPLFDEQGEPRRVAGFARDITERKQREQELQKDQKRMNLALESARAGMWEFVPETREEYWDENLYRLYGLDPQSVGASFETFLEVVHPEDRERVEETVREAVEKSKSYDLEYRILRDGDVRWIEARGRGWRSGNGSKKVVGVSLDITDQKRTEEALKESEQRFRAVAENIDDILYLYDADYSDVHYLNKAYESIWGRSREDVLESPWEFSEYIHESDRDEIVSKKESFLEDNSLDQWIDQYRIVRPDGEVRWVRDKMFKVRDETGLLVHVAGIMSDETDQRQLEKQLRDRQRQLDMALEAARAGVWTWYPQTGEETWDENLRQLFGVDESVRATHENFLEQIHPADRERLQKQDAKALASRESFTHEYRIQRGGETRWLQSKGQIVTSPDDSSLVVIGISLDITDQKQMQHELEQALDERSTLLQEVHHRVKNNLQMIVSLIRLQQRELELSEEAASIFEDLQSRIYTTSLVHEQVYRKASLTHINVRDYLRELAKHVIGSQSSSQEIELSTRLEPVDLSVETLLPCGLVTNELLTNAMQHGFEGRDEGRVEVEFRQQDDSDYELIVADDGVGWQADASFEEVQSLGMTLVKNIVRDQLHGSVEMTEPEQGVRFRIVIPEQDV